MRSLSKSGKVAAVALSFLAVEDMVNAASSPEDAAAYPDFAWAMENRGGDYFWRSHKVETTDGYILTMFEITGDEQNRKIKHQGKKGPLLLQHGYSSDSITWLNRLTDENELAIGSQLFEDGFSVWFGNVRGTRRSKEHLYWSPDSNGSDYKDYWDFDFNAIAHRDMPVFIRQMKENLHENSAAAECKKITLLGHSAGSQYIINTTIKGGSDTPKYIAQVINLESCIVPNLSEEYSGFSQVTYSALNAFTSTFGIRSLFGVNWDAQLALFCGDDYGTLCEDLYALKVHDESNMDLWSGRQESSVRQLKHMGQNDLYKNQFQEWAKYWPFIRNTDNIRARDLHPDVPIRFLWATEDKLCSEARAQKWVTYFPGRDLDATQYISGGHFSASGKNDAEFMVKIRAMLKDQGADMDDDVCNAPFKWGSYLNDNLVAMGLPADFFDTEETSVQAGPEDPTTGIDFGDMTEDEIDAWLKANPEIRRLLRQQEKELTRKEMKENEN